MVEDVLQLRRDDTLFLLGDYVDRGPDSKGVLDYLIGLTAAGYDVRPLLGNHESMLLKSARSFESMNNWVWNGGVTTLHDFGVKRTEDIPREYLDFLDGLPLLHVTDDYVLVHAGLHFGVPDPIKDTPPFFMLWERDYHVRPEMLDGRTLICGHTVTALSDIRGSLDKPVICLDNGCYRRGCVDYGNLVALNLDTRELLVLKNCEP